jgi:hypothetical protein
MPDNAAVGFWVRRFLSDHLIHERGVSRNTQQSYRDTFCLFLPFVRIPVKWAGDSGDVGQGRSEATLVVFLH